jgi:tight adherence protein B
MPFDIDPTYVVYALAAGSAILFAEAIYLIFFSANSYRSHINRRLRLMDGQPDREGILVQLRRERGLTAGGLYSLPSVSLNRLILQSGLTMGLTKFLLLNAVASAGVLAAMYWYREEVLDAIMAAAAASVVLPFLALRVMRARRHKKFGTYFPDALDVIVRSLRAGHPVPIAIQMVAREMPDPVGSEFGIVADEITYGADLETAMRSLFFRIGQEDLPLFVTAVAIQATTGGKLSEILENLSGVIRMRIKMRRKVYALAAEGRFSAMLLSAVPIILFLVLKVIAPDFYASVWHVDFTKYALAAAGGWMLIGNYIMYRMVSFKI